MNAVVCPHCQSKELQGPPVPKEVVVVMPCPHCHEWAVLFRGKIVPLKRDVILHGTRRERILHIAEVITEYLEAGILPEPGLTEEMRAAFGGAEPEAAADPHEHMTPISDRELEKFVKIDLKCIDNGAYFRRHFG